MGRPPCCDKANVKRGLWTPEEDAKILAYVANHGTGNWTLVPKKAGLNRCGKSCRLRWTNYLRPDLKHEGFSPHEEDLIVELHKAIGSRWSLIAKRLPGRTDNDVKNYWNTKLKKKLMKMGIDPITHKPFSQILSDYNNVSFLTPHAQQARSAPRVLIPPLAFQQPQPHPGLSPGPVPLFSQLHDHSIDIKAATSGVTNPGPFDELSPAASSCSSSSSSMTDARQRSVQISSDWSSQQALAEPVPSTDQLIASHEDPNAFYGAVQAEEAALQCDIFDVSDQDRGTAMECNVRGVETETSSSRCRETSSFVKAILDRDVELQLDLLSLNEFLDY